MLGNIGSLKEADGGPLFVRTVSRSENIGRLAGTMVMLSDLKARQLGGAGSRARGSVLIKSRAKSASSVLIGNQGVQWIELNAGSSQVFDDIDLAELWVVVAQPPPEGAGIPGNGAVNTPTPMAGPYAPSPVKDTYGIYAYIEWSITGDSLAW